MFSSFRYISHSICLAAVGALGLAQPAQSATYELPGLADSFRSAPKPGASSSAPPENQTLENKQLNQAIRLFASEDFETAEEITRGVVALVPESAEGWYLLGLILANLDRVDESVNALDRAATLYEFNAGPLTTKGDVLLSAGRRDEAKAAYLAAAERDRGDWRAHVKLGILAEEANDAEEAVRRYQLSLEKLPENQLHPRARLAKAYAKRGNPAAAMKVLEPYVLANPSDADGLKAMAEAEIAAGEFHSAARNLSVAIAADPTDVDALVSRATAEVKSGQIEKARHSLDLAAEIDGDNPEILFASGQLELALGNSKKAVGYFNRFVEISGKDTLAAPFLARAQVAAGEAELALRTLSTAAEKDAEAVPVWLALGELQAALGDMPASESAYRKLSQLASEDPAAHFRLASVLAVQAKFGDALASFDRGLALDPDNPQILRGATLAAVQNGEPTTALKHAARLTKVRNRSEPSLMMLAWVQEEAGDKAAAKATYREVIGVNPENVAALNNLAVIVSEGGDNDWAAELVETARKADPSAPYVWHTSGKVETLAGRDEKAVEMFREAVRLSPDNPGYVLDLGLALLRTGKETEGKAEITRSLDLGLPENKAELARSHLN